MQTLGIESFHNQMTHHALTQRQKENNQIYDGIEELKQLSSKAIDAYNELIAPHHFFAYSEMESYLSSISRLEELSKLILPKYSNYITDEASKEILNIKENISRNRDSHNSDFITTELADCKTYFDTVLGTYPLDPQQRDSIVKLEDNCLVIASAGSGKTSTILGKAKYLVEKRNIDPSRILLTTSCTVT